MKFFIHFLLLIVFLFQAKSYAEKLTAKELNRRGNEKKYDRHKSFSHTMEMLRKFQKSQVEEIPGEKAFSYPNPQKISVKKALEIKGELRELNPRKTPYKKRHDLGDRYAEIDRDLKEKRIKEMEMEKKAAEKKEEKENVFKKMLTELKKAPAKEEKSVVKKEVPKEEPVQVQKKIAEKIGVAKEAPEAQRETKESNWSKIKDVLKLDKQEEKKAVVQEESKKVDTSPSLWSKVKKTLKRDHVSEKKEEEQVEEKKATGPSVWSKVKKALTRDEENEKSKKAVVMKKEEPTPLSSPGVWSKVKDAFKNVKAERQEEPEEDAANKKENIFGKYIRIGDYTEEESRVHPKDSRSKSKVNIKSSLEKLKKLIIPNQTNEKNIKEEKAKVEPKAISKQSSEVKMKKKRVQEKKAVNDISNVLKLESEKAPKKKESQLKKRIDKLLQKTKTIVKKKKTKANVPQRSRRSAKEGEKKPVSIRRLVY